MPSSQDTLLPKNNIEATSEQNLSEQNLVENLSANVLINTAPQFAQFLVQGLDAAKFLQGQVTVNIPPLQPQSGYVPTAIANLKGRLDYGLWIKALDENSFEVVANQLQYEELKKHLKKYSAFSKLTMSEAETVYPYLQDGRTQFSTEPQDTMAWARAALPLGEYWIAPASMGLFQPQELRLHQRKGLDYDKGCYIGQEVIARLYFKAKPKRWLHLVEGTGDTPQVGAELANDIQVVNAIPTDTGWMGLVIAKPESLQTTGLTQLALPNELNGEVGRIVNNIG